MEIIYKLQFEVMVFMRKYYLDNIRIIVILLLFPYHTFMIWNNFGAKFYIWGGNNNILSSLLVLVSAWIMPVLFVIAGMSTRYSLKKRNRKQFIRERIKRIFIPFISGLILLVPFQTLYARKFFFNYDGSLLDNLCYFFTHFSDLNGYDGMFTFGHLWFLFYLFVITLLTLLVIKIMPFNKVNSKINRIGIILLFIPIFIFYSFGNFGGQSIGKYMLLYLLGYYLFSDDFIEKLVKHKAIILSLFGVSQMLLVVLYFKYNYYGDLLVNFVGWLGILSCIIIGYLFLNKENKLTDYFKKASFSLYILHQTILVIIGYYVLMVVDNVVLQINIIIFGSLILTILIYEIISRIPITKNIIGVR